MQPEEIQEIYRSAVRPLTDQLADSLSNVLLDEKIPLDVVNAATGEIIIPANLKITRPMLRNLAVLRNHIEIYPSPIRNRIREIIGSYEHKFAELELQYERLMQKTSAWQPIIELTKRAEADDAQAQYELGIRYFIGDTVLQNLRKAQAFFYAAAKQKHVHAQISLGDCYTREGNVAQAVEWYCKAAEQKSVTAMMRLGDYYSDRWAGLRYRDWFASMDAFRESVGWYSKAVQQGDCDAHYRLGELLSAFTQPADEGYRLAKRCSEYLDPVVQRVCHKLRSFHDENVGQVVLRLYYAAANRGHVRAQTALGDFFANRTGVAEDRTEAVRWYFKAAEQGYPEAQRKLGDCYAEGWIVPENFKENLESYRKKEAVKWYRKAAEQGDIESLIKLGDCYAAGKGVRQSEMQAAKWYRKAQAYEELGDLYATIGENRKAAKAYRKAGFHWGSSQIRNLGPKNTW